MSAVPGGDTAATSEAEKPGVTDLNPSGLVAAGQVHRLGGDETAIVTAYLTAAHADPPTEPPLGSVVDFPDGSRWARRPGITSVRWMDLRSDLAEFQPWWWLIQQKGTDFALLRPVPALGSVAAENLRRMPWGSLAKADVDHVLSKLRGES